MKIYLSKPVKFVDRMSAVPKGRRALTADEITNLLFLKDKSLSNTRIWLGRLAVVVWDGRLFLGASSAPDDAARVVYVDA